MSRLVVPMGMLLVVVVATAWPRVADVVAQPSSESFDHGQLRTLGVGSCASMACHHGNGARGAVGSEYSTWIAVDPHAKAYRVLFNPESLRMQEALAKHNPKMARFSGAHQNPLCLSCHGMGVGVPEALQADGAGCERCHGSGEKWKSTHYLPGFDRTTSPGFKDLRTNLVVRAEVCMPCHVGQGEQQVDHELIAAGHPRLRFEYAGYYASYPRHWGAEHRGIVDDEFRSWLIGQLTSAKTSLELLAFRAGNASGEWPEFAEYNCSACHQNLKAASPGKPTSLPWGTWYHDLLPALAETRPGTSGNQAELLARLEQLKTTVSRRLPSRAKVREEALASAASLDGWRNQIQNQCPDAAQIRAVLAVLARQEKLADTWDGGTQLYLSLAALHASLVGLKDDTSTLRDPLVRMRQELLRAYPAGRRPLYDSPVDYSPESARQALRQLRQRLE